jgi:hypothetical protein
MLRLLTLATRLTAREPARAWLMARMAVWVTILSALVKFVPLSRTLKIVSTNARTSRERTEDELEQLSSAIDALLETNVLMFKPSCWKRATVLHRYLALEGVTTSIVFGVLKHHGGELKGHAWLEQNGEPLLEPPGPAYKVTYKFPSRETAEIRLEIMNAAG